MNGNDQEPEVIDEIPETVDSEDEGQEVEQDQEPASSPEPEEPKTVPLQALQEERARIKELRTQNELLSSRFDQLLQHVQGMQKPKDDQPEPEQQPPNPEEDAFGYLDHQLKALAKSIEGLHQGTKVQQDQARQSQQMQALAKIAQESEARVRAEKPDYDDAFNHYTAARQRQLALQGMNQAQIAQTMHQEQVQMIAMATRNGQEPADFVYSWAETYGYVPKQAETAMPAPRQAKPAPKSLSGMAGKPPAKAPTAKDIIDMPQSEFEALYKSLSPQERRAIMG